jgi:quercetin dioxygenase-like cupin family protein
VGRFTFQPGWRWSECIKPVVGTDSCQAEHLGYAISGRIRIEHEDGTTADIGPGDAYVITPGHQAWVVGDEEFVGVEFKSAAGYAKS